MVDIEPRMRDFFLQRMPAINSPWRIALVSFVLSETITGALLWLIDRTFSPTAFAIAAVCSTLIPFLVSSRILEQQRIIQEKNRKLQSVTNQFRLANAELGERNVQLQAFSHTVAHDLQAPLSALTGLSRQLEENYTKVSTQTVRQHLRAIAYTTEKLSHIVDELLLLSQIQESDSLRLDRLHMAEIVTEVMEYLALVVDEYGAQITVPEHWPTAVGYGPWVQHVWINYLSNALKYGGRPPIIKVGASEEHHVVRFWVQDNGPGLTAEEQTKIFVPFTRLHETRAQGYGLGLSIVRNIVERLGGEVGVESSGEPGEGSCFYFTLPRAAESEQMSHTGYDGWSEISSPKEHRRARDLAAL